MHTSSYRGTVKGIHEDYEDNSKIRLEIAYKEPKRKRKKGDVHSIPDYTPTRSETVSADMARGLMIGDCVECVTTIKKVRTLKRK